ncbi:MAG: hypothetical protein JNL50_03205 [Phycisphaerae bacterium]|nr:hypothetical protein [Phycisphaerae bacterium]
MDSMLVMAWMLAQSGGLSSVLKFFGLSPKMLLIIVIGLVVAIAAWWLVKFIYKHREKAKELTLVRRMFASTSGGPAAGADPAKRAAIDGMRRSFEEGVEKFRAAGKNVYTLPWVLLAGPSGSGKTEAIRHCNVGFPPGLQNYLQGAGGTLNMHWWFTNDAVIIDTAGRIFMENAGTGGGEEWRELLKMLKDVRPLCPINGMLLCIGVDSLIKDSGDDIQEKAGKIAQQLDTIQRMLDVRFPVFVVVTKCDLITGFREFFENVTDPGLQHQMLGWSNPAALDTVFNPEQVSEHIETVRQRLLRRRYALMIDPVHTDDPQARRTDQVDALYALPDSLARLSSRLRRYLELIFVQGEWSPKPLFLRGIYFTSSMRQGAELDEELAKMLGVSVDKLPGGVSEEKSYFLRDVFKEKIFKEKGLVTRATNVDKHQARQRRVVVGSAIGAAVLLLGLTLLSSYSFRQEVGKKEESWRTIWGRMGDLSPLGLGGAAPAYRDQKDVKIGLDDLTRTGAVVLSRQLAEQPPSVPLLLKPVDLLGVLGRGGDFEARLKGASTALIEREVAAKLVEQARARMTRDLKEGKPWSDEATAVLAGLVRIERGEVGPAQPVPFDVDAFARYVLAKDEYAKAGGEAKQLQELVTWAYAKDQGGGEWPGAEGSLGRDANLVKAGVAAFNAHWSSALASDPALGKLVALRDKAGAFETAEQALLSGADPVIVKTLAEGDGSYARFEKSWSEKFGAIKSAHDELDAARKAADFGKPDALAKTLEAARTSLIAKASAAYATVLDEAAPEGAPGALLPTGVSSTTDKVAGQVNRAGEAAGKAIDALGIGSKDWAGDLKARQQEMKDARGKLATAIGAEIDKLKAQLDEKSKSGGVLASRPSDDFEFAARFRAYAAADGAVRASAPPAGDTKPKWGELTTAEKARVNTFGAARTAIQKDFAQAGDAASAGTGAGKAWQVVGLAEKAARTRAVASALEGTSGDAGWVKDRVRDLSKALPAGVEARVDKRLFKGKLDLPGAPLASASSTELFDPNGAAMVLDDFKFAKTDAAARFLSDSGVGAKLDAAEVAVKGYAGEYFTAWTQTTIGNAAPRFESWDAARDAAGKLGLGSSDWSQKLADLEALMIVALDIPGLDLALGARAESLKQWQQKLGADRDALNNSGSSLRVDVPNAVGQKFAALAGSPVEARRQIGNMAATDFAKGYFASFDPKVLEGGVQGVGESYWSLARFEMLRVLAETYANHPDRVRFDQAKQFPLYFDGAALGGGKLSKERVQKIIDALPASANAAAGGTRVQDGAKTGIVRVDEQLDELFKADPFLAGKQELVASLRAWGGWLLADKTVSVVALADHGYVSDKASEQLRSPAGAQAAIGGAIFTELKMNGVTVGITNEGTELITGMGVPSSDVGKLKVDMKGGAANQTGTWAPSSEWGALELLCQNGAEPADASWKPLADANAPSKFWRVPVFFTDAGGKAYFVRVGLRFSVDVPARALWPQGGKW